MTSASETARSTVAQVLAAVTKAEVPRVYGLVGNGNAEYVAALRKVGVDLIGARHEAGAMHAAMTDARIGGGRVGVATVTFGPGFTNTLTSLTECAKFRVPVVLVAGAAPVEGSRPWDVDQRALAAALGVDTVEVTQEAPRAAARTAFSHARDARQPVVLALPAGLDGQWAHPEADDELDSDREDANQVPDPLRVRELARLLREARRPVLLAGRGAWLAGARDALRRVGRLTGALEFTSAAAHGFFVREPGDFGICGGFAEAGRAEIAANADLVVAFGASLNPFTLRFGAMFPKAERFCVDVEGRPQEGWKHIPGDARSWAEAIAAELEGERERAVWAGAPSSPTEPTPREDGLDPRELAAELERIMPADRSVILDGGHFVGWPALYWSSPDPDSFLLTGAATQSIGLGVSAALGAVSSRPERLTVLATGDGGLLMGLADLSAVVSTARSLLIVVFNDGMYGAEWHHYAKVGVQLEDVTTDPVDFAGVAAAMGATGYRITRSSELRVVDEWLRAGGFGTLLVDCKISRSEIAPYFRELIGE